MRKSHVAAPHGASVSHRCSLHEDGLVTWTSNEKPSHLRRYVDNDVPVARDLAVGDGAEVVSDDHSQDDDPNMLTCDNTTFDGDDEAPSFCSNFVYTTVQIWTVSLLKILDHTNAPDYTFGEVLACAHSASANNYSYNPIGGLLYSKNVDALINNGNKFLPFAREVDSDHVSPSDVICFDFVAQLLSLLQNSSI